MYSTFPYGNQEYHDFKSQLESYSPSDFKETLQKNKKVLKEIISTSFTNQLLIKTLFDFIDEVIGSKSSIPSSSLTKLLENLYDTEIEFNLDQQKKLDKFEASHDHSTTNTEDLDTEVFSDEEYELRNQKLYADDSRTLVKLDQTSKTLEKAILLNIFNDLVRMQKSTSPQNIQAKVLSTPYTEWLCAADSFTGLHTHGVNSDKIALGKGNNGFLASVIDGVTFPYTDDDLKNNTEVELLDHHSQIARSTINEFSAHNFSTTLSRNLAEFDFLKLKDIQVDLHKRQELNLEKTFQDCETHSSNPIENLAKTALLPLKKSLEKTKDDLKEKYKNLKKDFNASAAINYAFELGDKTIIVKMGDADAQAYDQDGKILDARLVLNITEYTNSFKYLAQKFKFDKETQSHDCETVAKNKYEVRVYETKDVDQIALISDGAAIYNETRYLPENLNIDIRENLAQVAASINLNGSCEDIDDKSAVFIKKHVSIKAQHQ